jgi:DNA-binding NtrC family response regulator
MLETYRRILRTRAGRIILAENGREGLKQASRHDVDVVLLDLRMPGENGMDILYELKRLPHPPEVIIITGHGSVTEAVDAMKRGAADFIEKPFSPIQLTKRIEPLLRIRELEAENEFLRNPADPDALFPDIIGSSEVMRGVKSTIIQLAGADVTVTITGESGTGKELVARALHVAGPRRDKPFIAVDCGALPESMVESELFGYQKGAFTGAHQASPGLFRSADGGTLFFDEIGELPPSMQTRLLRSLQNREVRPIGSAHPVPVDVRVITATNMDLRQAVTTGTFREDLFYRLTAVILRLPPLREHRDDIPELADHILRRYTANDGKPYELSPAAMDALKQYPWPGNVRELENILSGACALSSRNAIDRDDLRIPVVPADTDGDGFSGLSSAKDKAIDEAMAASGGNKRQAAELLGIAESTVYRNLKRRNLL